MLCIVLFLPVLYLKLLMFLGTVHSQSTNQEIHQHFVSKSDNFDRSTSIENNDHPDVFMLINIGKDEMVPKGVKIDSDYPLEQVIEPWLSNTLKVETLPGHEILPVVFMSNLMNWLFGQHKIFKRRRQLIDIDHEVTWGKDPRSKLSWGRSDLVINLKKPNGAWLGGMIIEMKAWNVDIGWKQEDQLCRYLYGYQQEYKRVPVGVLSNIRETFLYNCTLNDDADLCNCNRTERLSMCEVEDGTWATVSDMYVEPVLKSILHLLVNYKLD